MKVVLKGKELTDRKELHRQLKIKLALPDYYGENLDALWDCLTRDLTMPLTIEWTDFNESKKALGEYAIKTLEVFQEAEKEVEGFRIIVEN